MTFLQNKITLLYYRSCPATCRPVFSDCQVCLDISKKFGTRSHSQEHRISDRQNSNSANIHKENQNDLAPGRQFRSNARRKTHGTQCGSCLEDQLYVTDVTLRCGQKIRSKNQDKRIEQNCGQGIVHPVGRDPVFKQIRIAL